MTLRRWKVGLLGAGFICEAHAKALNRRSDIELVAVCDHARDKAAEAAARFGIKHVFSSLDDMLADELDVVHVLLPPDRHIDAAQRILQSGRNVFVEKPMGLISAECQALVDYAREKRLKLAVNHNFLFLPSCEKLRRDVSDGTLGKLDQVTINWLYPLGLIQSGPFNNWMLKDPRNLFFETAPHLLAFVMDLVGPLDRVQAFVGRPIDLPGGARVYRHWHVHASKGHTAVDLVLSFTSGAVDRSVRVRAHGAVAKCDFDRDLYYRDESTGHGMLFDNFLRGIHIARQIGFGSATNVLKSVLGTLRKAPDADPFGESIGRSVNCFYNTLQGKLDSRLEGQFGADIIAECERIINCVEFDAPQNQNKPAVVSLAQQPTVLVLGGTGFIGRHLVRALVARGLAVRVATRGLASAQMVLAGLRVELVQGDLADPVFLDSALENIDVVYDLAKAVGTRWEDYYKHDVLVTRNIAERAIAKRVKRFIYTGTIDSYYSAREGDIITADTPLDSELLSRNHYARSKAACESLLMDLHREHGFPVVIFRPGIVIGKGCPPAHWGVGMFLSDTRMKYWGDGRNKLPFVLVDDVVNALMLALDKPGLEGRAFLLTDEPLLSSSEYVEAVSGASGTRVRADATPIWKHYVVDLCKEAVKHLIRHPNRKIPSFRDWDCRTQRARYDSSATRHALGWEPVASREEIVQRGIVDMVRDYLR